MMSKPASKKSCSCLETTPDSLSNQTGVPNLLTSSNDIPNQRERLAVLISTGKSKEAIGVQLTHEQVKRPKDKEVAKFYKRYEAYVGNKMTESLIDSFMMLVSKGVGMLVSIDDVKELQKEVKNDYVINQQLSSIAGGLYLRSGRLLAVASTALITTKHIVLDKSEPDIVELANKDKEETGEGTRKKETKFTQAEIAKIIH